MSCRVVDALVIENVLPAIENVPADILFCMGRSINRAFKSRPPLNFEKVLFSEDISVLVALECTLTVKSPVRAPASADAENAELRFWSTVTLRALNRLSSESALAAPFKVSSWLFKVPNMDTLSLFSFFSCSRRLTDVRSRSINWSTIGCQSKPDARPVNFMSEPILPDLCN